MMVHTVKFSSNFGVEMMIKMTKKMAQAFSVGAALTLAACASTPVITTSEAVNESLRHTVYAFYIRAGGNQQLASMIWDNATGSYELKVASENETFIRSILENLVATGVPAIIGGIAGIQIAEEGSCGDGNCGTVIWNDGTSSSISASGAVTETQIGIVGALENEISTGY